MSATTFCASSGVWLWLITTLAPAAASAVAMALPIPVAAPVTRAVLPPSGVTPADAAVDSVTPDLRPTAGHGAVPLAPRQAPGSRWSRAGRSSEPVVQVHLGAFAEVGAEAAFAAQAGQLPGARPGDHKPVAADNVVLDRAGVLEQECAAPPAELAGDPLDTH